MRVGRQRKDPDSISLHSVDWSKWLANRSTTISASSWALPAPLGPAVADTFNDTTASVTIQAAGVLGTSYEITNHIITLSGLEEDAVMIIRMTEK